ncbi:MAG: hypothetical protein QXD04_00145 [Candidatus Bathyarchaeia archaeon]|nr:hypothetical protein [Candidatus Bathyarchaeota archaeon]
MTPLRELVRILGELRYRSPSPKLCPVCGSPRIKQALLGIIPPIYVCESCGYRGSLALEVHDEAEGERGLVGEALPRESGSGEMEELGKEPPPPHGYDESFLRRLEERSKEAK